MGFEHLDKQSNRGDGVLLGKEDGVALSLAQLVAQLRNDLEVEIGIVAQPGLKRGRRYPIEGCEGYCGNRVHIQRIS